MSSEFNSHPAHQDEHKILYQNDYEILCELPKNMIQDREQAWNKLFDKYSAEVSEDMELNLNELSSEMQEVEDEDGVEDDEDDDDDEYANDNEGNVYEKCRTPIRKHPSLVQYWIDTGNPPYRLVDDENLHSETGSSLSEGEKPYSPILIENHDEKANDKSINNPSPCSSVDTAAYILSNTNVTKKSDAIVIVEGAKNAVFCSLVATVGSPRESCRWSQDDDLEPLQVAAVADNNNICSNPTNLGTKTDKLANKSIDTTTVLRDEENFSNKIDKNNFSPTSVRITDVLPTLKQLDELMSEDPLNDDLSLIASPKVKQQPRKSLSRKKLYTGRNSPIDIIISTASDDLKLSNSNLVHPAFVDSPSSNWSYSKQKYSRLSRKKKKRLTQLPTEQAPNNDVQEHFFESIGLTPNNSKTNDSQNNSVHDHVDENQTIFKKVSELKKLCDTKRLVICLEKIPTNQKYSTSSDNTIQKKCQNIVNIPDILSISSQCTVNTNNVQEIDFDSQESDQSTILLYHCADDQKQLNEKRSMNTTIITAKNGRKNVNKLLNKSDDHNTKVSITDTSNLPEKLKESDIKQHVTFSSQSLMTELDELPIENDEFNTPRRIRKRFDSRIKFLVDEDDAFVKTVRKNRDESRILQSHSNEYNSNTSSNHTTDDVEPPLIGKILDTDDEEDNNLKIVIPRIKKVSKQRQLSSNGINKSDNTRELTVENPKSSHVELTPALMKNSTVRILKFCSDSSEASASSESLLLSPKKLKVQHRALTTQSSPRSITNDVSSSVKVRNHTEKSILLSNVQSVSRKRKEISSTHSDNEDDTEVINTSHNNSLSRTKDRKITRKKRKSSQEFSRTSPKVNGKNKKKELTVNITRMENQATSLTKKKRKTINIKRLVESDSESSVNETESHAFDKSNELISTSLNSTNKNNGKSNDKSKSTTLFFNLFDSITDDVESLLTIPYHQNSHVSWKKSSPINKRTVSFRTQLYSDSDD